MKLNAIVVVALVSTAGCIFGECGPTDTARTIQPGLYQAIASNHLEVTTTNPSFGLDAGSTMTSYLPGARVVYVVHTESTPTQDGPQRPFREASLSVGGDSALSITLPINATDDEARGVFLRFVENVSASPERWDEWEAALLAQLHNQAAPVLGEPQPARPMPAPAKTARIPVQGDWKIPNLISKLGLDTPPAPNLNLPGDYHLAKGPWKIDLLIPHVEHERTINGGKLRVSVDALDQTFITYEMKESPNENHTQVLDALAAFHRELNLPPANLTSNDFSTMVC